MPLILPGNVASATAATGYEIANSLRFNSGDSAKLQITSLGTPSDAKKWTWSGWVKMAKMSGDRGVMRMFASVNDYTALNFNGNGQLEFDNKVSGSFGGRRMTSAYYRDPAAWMHIVAVFDSDNGTGDDRMILYVNGSRITAFGTDTDPSSGEASGLASGNTTTLGLSGTYYNGCYLAEVVFIDGQALAPTEFGEYDSDSPTIWKPKDPSGLTFGDEGYWLDFENSGDLGNDVSGNNNDFDTVTNLVAADQGVDSPTNNFCTMNPLDNEFVDATFSEGNNQLVIASGTKAHATGTMGVSAGKWYWEIECDASDGDDQSVSLVDRVSKDGSTDTYSSSYPYNYVYQSQGRYVNNGSVTDTDPDSFTSGDIIGVALDLTNNKLYFAKNNTWQDSGDPTSGSTGTGAMSITAASGTLNGFYFPAVGSETTSRGATWKANFGGCSAFDVSSAANDGNGYGNFEYAPPSGYLALCTKNLGSDGG